MLPPSAAGAQPAGMTRGGRGLRPHDGFENERSRSEDLGRGVRPGNAAIPSIGKKVITKSIQNPHTLSVLSTKNPTQPRTKIPCPQQYLRDKKEKLLLSDWKHAMNNLIKFGASI